MRTIIAFTSQKGGVGKTTSVVGVGLGLGKMNHSVLLIDLDPQGNATYHLGITPGLSIADVLMGRASIGEAITKRGNLDVIPATLALAQVETEIFSVPGREHLLQRALERVGKTYAFILIDCPPSLGILTLNALVAAKEVFVPVEVQALPLQGLRALDEVVTLVRERINPSLAITGIIATRFDSRRRLNREVLETLGRHFGAKLFKTVIRENVRLAEAPSHGKSIFEYAPRSHGAEDYMALCKEISRRYK